MRRALQDKRSEADQPLVASHFDRGNKEHDAAPTGQQLSCELLAFAVMHQSFRARVYVMRHGVVQHALRLLSAPQRFLQLAPVRLLQAAFGSKDEAYHRYLVKCGFFTPLLRAFEQSVRPPALGGNLLVSAVLQALAGWLRRYRGCRALDGLGWGASWALPQAFSIGGWSRGRV